MEIIDISFSGPERRIVDRNGKEWFFEMHRYCGPIVLKKDGDPRQIQPAGNSQFWQSVTDWAQQGEKIEDGYCKYEDTFCDDDFSSYP